MAGDFALTYDPTATYNVGDYCTYQYQLYICKTAITTAQATFDASYWTQISLSNEVDDVKTQVNDINSDLYTESDNLFDFDSKIANKVPGSVGSGPNVFADLNNWYTSNYIPVEAGKQYALILNESVTQTAIFRVACYANNVMTYKTDVGTESNPFTIPEGVDHIRFYSNTASLFSEKTNASFKLYSENIDLMWTPFGYIKNFLTLSEQTLTNTQKETVRENIGAASESQLNTIDGQVSSITGRVSTVEGKVDDTENQVGIIESDLYTESDNLFDFDSKIANKVPGAVGSGPDVMADLSGWYTSNYIPVTAGEQYALILNGIITTGAVFRVACYRNDIMTQKSSGNEANPFTIPTDVDHIRFFSNTASLFSARTNTSFKAYSANMDKSWTPYEKIENFLKKGALPEYGVYVSENNYYHFVNFGDQTLIRLFKREGPNNLFQFSSLSIGNVNKYGVFINETIATNGTDTVGPISIMRQGVDSGGMWSGGWHTRTINSVAYPTAEQESLDVKVNGVSVVGHDGLYYGQCVATVVNKLYFPQTITGADLNEATEAIEETVQYILNEKMTARVSHKYVVDTRVILYYGMQAVRIGFDNILLPNNETAFAFADMTTNMNLEKPESLIQMKNNDWTYDLEMKSFGLANYTHNPGTGSTKYGYLPVSTRKVYWTLIEGSYDYSFISSGKVLAWEGEWNIYPN